MKSFADYYALACMHKGGEAVVLQSLPSVLENNALKAYEDSQLLSLLCRRVFRAGLKHSLVDSKWPQFEAVFNGFDPYFCAMQSEDDIDQLMKDARIIRHRGKLNSIRHNAQFVIEMAREYGNFGAYLAHWRSDQTVDLWWDLKKKGKQLGGNSGASFLRMAGKDTFLLTPDVVAVLRNEEVISREPTSKRDMLASQRAFITWQQESERPLCEISRIISFAAT